MIMAQVVVTVMTTVLEIMVHAQAKAQATTAHVQFVMLKKQVKFKHKTAFAFSTKAAQFTETS